MSGYDTEPAKTTDDASKKHDAKDAKTPVGVDPSAVGQALQHILTAHAAVGQLEKLARPIMNKAQDRDVADQVIIDLATKLDDPAATANAELTTAWQMLSRTISDEIDLQHRPVADAKAAALNHPGMRDAVEKLTLDLSQVVSSIDGITDVRQNLRYDNKVGSIIGGLSHVRALVGLPELGWNALLQKVNIKVAVGVVDLGTGNPRNVISESVNEFTASWNVSADNLVSAVNQFVTTISMSQVEKAESGVMEMLWDHVKELLVKGAAILSGTELAGTIGLGLIRSRGHTTRGGYDGEDGYEGRSREAVAAKIHG